MGKRAWMGRAYQGCWKTGLFFNLSSKLKLLKLKREKRWGNFFSGEEKIPQMVGLASSRVRRS